MEELNMRPPYPGPEIIESFDDGRPKITRAAELEGSKLKLKLLNMTDGEAYEYLNNMKLEAYQEGYADCLRKD